MSEHPHPARKGTRRPTILHADGWIGDGRTLCGIVEEGDATVGLEKPMIAKVGETVDCCDCRHAILHVRRSFADNYVVRRD